MRSLYAFYVRFIDVECFPNALIVLCFVYVSYKISSFCQGQLVLLLPFFFIFNFVISIVHILEFVHQCF